MPAKDSRILYLSDNQQSRKDYGAKGLRVGNEQVSFPIFILQCFKELLFCCCKGTVFMTDKIDLSQSWRTVYPMPKHSSGGKESFLPRKTSFPRLESFWKHIEKICFVYFYLADQTTPPKLPRKSALPMEERENSLDLWFHSSEVSFLASVKDVCFTRSY